jgi:hypothetical protein
MANITLQRAQAWAESSKLTLSSLDAALEQQIATEVLSRLSQVFDVSTWVDETSTPAMVQEAIAMYYVSWQVNRTYGVDAESNDPYAGLLRGRADMIITGILTGTYTLLDDPQAANADAGQPIFYPTDDSSALDPRDFPDDTSVGPAKFSMGMIF